MLLSSILLLRLQQNVHTCHTYRDCVRASDVQNWPEMLYWKRNCTLRISRREK
jgi:hypothetical protein